MKNLGTYKDDLSTPRKKDVEEKQDKIMAAGLLEGDGAGGVSAAETVDAELVDMQEGLPTVTTEDNGKFLRVVSGAWAAVDVPEANGRSF